MRGYDEACEALRPWALPAPGQAGGQRLAGLAALLPSGLFFNKKQNPNEKYNAEQWGLKSCAMSGAQLRMQFRVGVAA